MPPILAESFLRSYDALWMPLDSITKQRYIAEFTDLRRVDPSYSNWLLFSATVESFLRKAGAPSDTYRISSSLRKIEEWYVGDGWYSDGPRFAFDYYNSFVIHPMYIEALEIITEAGKREKIWKYARLQLSMKAIRRAQRFGSNPRTPHLSGRYATCFRTFYHLPHRLFADISAACVAQLASRRIIKRTSTRSHDGCHPTYVRQTAATSMTAGFLTLGFNGSQPGISDYYTNNGSLYMASLAFLPLGLSCR